MHKSLTIIVPVYNEEENIHRLATVLNAYCSNALIPTSVLIVNDCSTDNSAKYIIKICKTYSAFKSIHLKQNYGLSTAIKAGFDTVTTSLVGYIDADLQTNPKDFDLLLKHIDNYQLVTGVRMQRKDTVAKNISSKLANTIRRCFTNDGMDDTGCPLKIIHTTYAKRIPMFRGLHRFLPAMVLLQKGTIKQVPISHYPRIAGYSKFGLRNRFFGPLLDCFAYLWMKRKYINYTIEKTSCNE